MRPIALRLLAPAVVLLATSLPAYAGDAAPADHGWYQAGDVQWGPAPPSLPPGAKAAMLEGDPRAEGIFTLRLACSDGYRIPPHWHPAFEHVTVIKGGFGLGMGETFDKAKGRVLEAGGFSWMAPGMRHFGWCEGDTVLQVHGMGPWQLIYVNPVDDPRNAK